MTENQNSNEKTVHEKKSLNLLFLGCISIVMLFAGLISAYLVVKSGNFWVAMDLPSWFIGSTIIIGLSSLTFYLALKFAKENKKSLIKIMMALTLVGGIGFTISQYLGWKQMVKNGYFLVGPIVSDGYYGQHMIATYNGKVIEQNSAGGFEIDNQPLAEMQQRELNAFFKALYEADHLKKVYKLDGFKAYGLQYRYSSTYRPVSFKNDQLMLVKEDGTFSPSPGLATVVKSFAENMVEDRGYFWMDGKYGEDFTIMYDGKPLEFKNGGFFTKDGESLTEDQLADLEESQNVASSFIYILSFLHLLHLFGGWLYVIAVFSGSIKEKYGSHNYLKIKLGSIYWHFLGGLWLFLYLFLTFIH